MAGLLGEGIVHCGRRRFDHARLDALVADFDLDRRRGATPAGGRQRDRLLSVGEKLPLVVSPVLPTVCTGMWARITPRSSSSRPAKSRASGGRERRLADEVAPGSLRSTVQRRPDLVGRDRFVHVLAVEVHAGFQAQRVARAEARRAARRRRAAPAMHLPQRRRAAFRSRPRRCSRCGRPASRRPPTSLRRPEDAQRFARSRGNWASAASSAAAPAGPTAIMATASGGRLRRRWVSVARPASLPHPGDVLVGGAGVDHDAETSA